MAQQKFHQTNASNCKSACNLKLTVQKNNQGAPRVAKLFSLVLRVLSSLTLSLALKLLPNCNAFILFNFPCCLTPQQSSQHFSRRPTAFSGALLSRTAKSKIVRPATSLKMAALLLFAIYYCVFGVTAASIGDTYKCGLLLPNTVQATEIS